MMPGQENIKLLSDFLGSEIFPVVDVSDSKRKSKKKHLAIVGLHVSPPIIHLRILSRTHVEGGEIENEKARNEK